MISIIIPVFNGLPFISRCIQSALTQSYQNIEILVINDGSTDLSKNEIQEFRKRDSRITDFHIDNSGVSAARKVGIDNAAGDWICFLDVDDTLPEKAIETYSKWFNDRPDIIASGECDNMTLSEYKSGLMRRTSHPELWGKLFKADFIKKHYPSLDRSIIIGEDQTINLVLANHAKKLITIPELQYHYNLLNPGSVTKRFRRTNDYELKFERLFNEIVRPDLDSSDKRLQYGEYKMKIEGFKMVILDGNRFDPGSEEWKEIVEYYHHNPKQLAISERLIIKLSHHQSLYYIIMKLVLFFVQIKRNVNN